MERGKRARVVFLVVLVVAIGATFVGEKTGWLTTVATRERSLSRRASETVAVVRSAAAEMPGWTLKKDDGVVLEWEASGGFLGFADDVRIEVQPVGQGTQLSLRSQSPAGASDFGINGRRLDAFLGKLDTRLGAGPALK